MSVPQLGTHTTAIVAALASGAGVAVGDGQRPDGGGWQGAEGHSPFAGYVVVYPISAGFDGPLADTHADSAAVWQTTCVGATRQQAQHIADTARSWLLANGRTVTIAGYGVAQVAYDGGGDVRRDDTTKPPLFYAVDRYRFTTTPTP